MIFLRTDTGSQKVDSWDEITSRPNFITKIAKGDHKFKEIIGYYQFKEELHCGLSGCNQPHQKGYIVRTTEGIETNIGNKCGKNEFGVEFGDHVLSFNDFMRLETNRGSIIIAKRKSEEWIKSLELLRRLSPSIDFCAQYIDKIKNSNYSGKLGATEIRLLAKSQSGNVTLSEVETDEKTKTILFGMHKYMRDSGEATSEYDMGKVSFVRVLLPENNLRNLYRSIIDDINAIQTINLESSPSPLVSDIAQKANTIEERIKKIKSLHHESGKFLTKKNLSPIVQKIKYSSTATDNDLKTFELFLRELR
ncbi:hypothetical protein AU693_003922 [Salmonella enterica subsp. diarizonae]|nr:hypothetical protein [Salmonella enterica]EEJ5470889.1 hypothetical protein [Salmonella enterica subsp. diarizonae]